MSQFSMETLYEIWNDKHGDKIEVGPDRNSLDLVEIRQIEGGKIHTRISMPREQAGLVAEAIVRMLR